MKGDTGAAKVTPDDGGKGEGTHAGGNGTGKFAIFALAFQVLLIILYSFSAFGNRVAAWPKLVPDRCFGYI